jgi:hypothetical protein
MVAFGPTKDERLKAFLKDCDRSYGLPSNTRGLGGTYEQTFCAWSEAFYETQAAYLMRHALITAEELASETPFYARIQRMHADKDDCPALSVEVLKAWLEMLI